MPDLLDSKAVAARVGVKVETIHYYHKKGMMPPADSYFGRSPVWQEPTIDEWITTRRQRTTEPEETAS